MRHRLSKMILAPAIVLAAACSKDKPATDASLNNDLTLAAQARQNAPLDSITAAERLNGGTARAPAALGTTTAAAPVATTQRRTHRARSSSGGNVSSGHEVTVKHTQRDAAIGAVAGAGLCGATRQNVKGGLIGAAPGGHLRGGIREHQGQPKKQGPRSHTCPLSGGAPAQA